MKPLLVGFSDIEGGAARASFRLHQALRAAGVSSEMLVNRKDSADRFVTGSQKPIALAQLAKAKFIDRVARQFWYTSNPVMHSYGVFPSDIWKRINLKNVDIVNFHWIGLEMMSIGQIQPKRMPVVWTLHDMWTICGAEHYSDDFRWRDGYLAENRTVGEKGVDINRLIWERKLRQWSVPIPIVTPSRWLASLVQQSPLTKDWPVFVIPNPIDLNVWRPIDRAVAKSILGLDVDKKLIVFGSMGGAEDKRKGFDLLLGAIEGLGIPADEVQFGVIGSQPALQPKVNYHLNFFGRIHDDITLRVIYSAADVVVIPSRQDNLPNIGVESLACGTPVVAYSVGGLSDIVDHKVNGYLASPFSSDDLANGIRWAIDNEDLAGHLRARCRKSAVDKFSAELVSGLYRDLYTQVLEGRVDGL